STKKPTPKKQAKNTAPKKAAAKKPAAKKAPAAKKPTAKPARAATPKSAKGKAGSKATAPAVRGANGRAKASAANQTLVIIGNHQKDKDRRLDPFTRAQKEKLLQLRDAMVDSMAGVAQDTLRAR